MLALEVMVILTAAVLLCTVVARRLGVAPPVLFLVGGALLALFPALRDVHLPPETVLLLFLPALLYWESLTTSLREIRSNLRGILLMSTLLVAATAGAVAAAAHLLGLPWGPAWILGAAVAPTDATAVGTLTRSLPRRNVTLLRAESLINDGTALVLYSIAVAVTVGEVKVDAAYITWSFLLSYVGGAATGALIACFAVFVIRHLNDALLQNIAQILTPLAAFLVAELIHASGVLAVVVAGLVVSRLGPRVGRAEGRQQTEAFWTLSTFLLNASLFVLVGLELPSAVRGLAGPDLWIGLAAVGIVSVIVSGVRFAFLFIVTYAIRLFDRRPEQKLRRVSHRERVISGLSGFRGAVSLAAALAVPETVASGDPLADRDMIIFVTAGVIVITLVLPGLLLPAVVRWANLPPDESVEQERSLAETRSLETALEVLPVLAAGLGADAYVTDRVRLEYETRLRIAKADATEPDGGITLEKHEQATALRLALLNSKRATILQLRDTGEIDDIVLRAIQQALDLEEVHLTGPTSFE
ncbi:Na+/H+ antiporter [Arthrobacter sp. FW306-2-2C-D06B]|uniref:Na+/H+ antiporter n=1 Tax=Arthrobacter sp. FW306-2-2C-D06B TaxID=2879618 RepID=UPI001EFFA769|nr:Na+/H+ antiporter [Arthrobacter sp. FW306-2-2C-D06B]UKA60438.1 Na+/H+ antiporter [Arthrobacter sp. FW306-2-2C-D06B]